MKSKSIAAWALLAAAATLLAHPSSLRAERSPIREAHPPYSASDPEVPDGRMPSRAYSSNHQSATIEDAGRSVDVPRSRAVRPESWREKVLRILRALALRGSVR